MITGLLELSTDLGGLLPQRLAGLLPGLLVADVVPKTRLVVHLEEPAGRRLRPPLLDDVQGHDGLVEALGIHILDLAIFDPLAVALVTGMMIRSPATAVKDVVGGGIADVLEGPVGVLGGIGHGGTGMIEFVIHDGGCAIFSFGYVLCQRIGAPTLRAGGRHIGVVSSGYVALADLLLLLPLGARPGALRFASRLFALMMSPVKTRALSRSWASTIQTRKQARLGISTYLSIAEKWQLGRERNAFAQLYQEMAVGYLIVLQSEATHIHS